MKSPENKQKKSVGGYIYWVHHTKDLTTSLKLDALKHTDSVSYKTKSGKERHYDCGLPPHLYAHQQRSILWAKVSAEDKDRYAAAADKEAIESTKVTAKSMDASEETPASVEHEIIKIEDFDNDVESESKRQKLSSEPIPAPPLLQPYEAEAEADPLETFMDLCGPF